MGLEAPVRGGIHAGGGEGGEAQLVLAGGDVLGDGLQGLEVGDVSNAVAGLLQQSGVGDEAVGLGQVGDAQNRVAVLQREGVVGQLAVEGGTGHVIAVVLPGLQADGAVHLEQGGSFGLGDLGLQGILVGAGGGGDDGHRDAGLSGVGGGKGLPGLSNFGLEVEVVNGAGLLGAGDGCQGQHQGQSQNQGSEFLHDCGSPFRITMSVGNGEIPIT